MTRPTLSLVAFLLGSCAVVATPPAPKADVVVTPTSGPTDGGAGVGCAGVGNACATGNPGACNVGHLTCKDGLPTCTPDVTTQPCYAGPKGTLGVGACTGGVQSCLGTLGACEMQTIPAAAENCFNDLDDDCDGRVNNGCPVSLAIGQPRPLSAQGGTTGSARSARCPAGSFVTRTQILFDDTDSAVSGLKIWCGTPTLARGTQSYTLGISPVMPAPYTSFAGSVVTDPPQDANCGGVGLVSGASAKGRADTAGIYGLGMYCADAQATLNADNTLTVKLSPNSTGDYAEYPYGATFESTCASNEVLIGYDGRVSKWMTRVQAICAPLEATYQ